MRPHLVSAAALLIAGLSQPAAAVPRDGERDSMHLLAEFPTGKVNSDIAFWGDKAYVGNYAGFRIFDISGSRPRLLRDFACFGPQNDPVVWDGLLFLAVDQTLTGPECGATATAHDDPKGWEGVRIFDVRDARNPRFITGVYTDCGAHTITLFPDEQQGRVLLYVSSYPLRPGPTCGPKRGPAVGRDPLHGVIQVLQVPLADPAAAREIAEPPIAYPGDPDNRFDPAEHGLTGFNPLRACHDIGVFVELRLAGAACAEQAQLWRIGPEGIPDTTSPIWIFDDNVDVDGAGGGDVAVDFWHSATFSWDGRVVNFIDESFGDGCPPVTAIGAGATAPNSDTGRMFFLDTSSGSLLSRFMIPRPEPDAYCSAHLGNTVPARNRYLLVNAWYMGGSDVIDFTNPTNPREIAFFDAAPAGPAGSDNWSAYWYERRPAPQGSSLTLYGNDGVHQPETGRGFEAFKAFVGPVRRVGLDRLNPQTQERRLLP